MLRMAVLKSIRLGSWQEDSSRKREGTIALVARYTLLGLFYLFSLEMG